MALRLKTVQYAFPVLPSLTNNSLTNLTPITVYLPEATKTFRKVWVDICTDDNVISSGSNYTTKTVNLRLGAAGYTSTTNGNTLTNSAENISLFLTREFTSHFVTNWTGTSMTCDVQLQINQASGTVQTNVNCVLNITYEYDDAASTHLKTVWIPLDMPAGHLPTTKTSHDTIPALTTYLPEASKVFRNVFITVQGGRNHANTTDFTVSYELSSLGVHTTGNYEAALSTDTWTRYIWDITTYLSDVNKASTHTFNVWSSLASRFSSSQAWLTVTYEFDPASSTSIMNSLILPMEIDSPMGGTNAADFQRATRELMVQEASPSLQRLAAYVFWGSQGNMAGLNARLGTGSFVEYTNTGSGIIAGFKGLMIRNDAPTGLTFARGRNILQLDIYNTSTSIRGNNVSSFWIVNYTSSKATGGVGAHNHTVLWLMDTHGSGAAVTDRITSAGSPIIPETNYYITALGFHFEFVNNSTNITAGVGILAERLASGEGGLIWESIYADAGGNDSEVGLNTVFSQARFLFTRWPGDQDTARLPLETDRRYRLWTPGSSLAAATANTAFMEKFCMILNYHTITFTVGGDISGSGGGTVTIDLHRASSGERLLQTSRSGDGAFSFSWYDNTEEVFISAYEDATHIGRSDDGLATGSP